MTRLPRVTGKEVMAALMRKGFSLLYVRGSHHYFQPKGFFRDPRPLPPGKQRTREALIFAGSENATGSASRI